MFGNLGKTVGNVASGASNMIKMKQQQDKMEAMMKSVSVKGVSKNGKVSVVLNGKQEIIDIKIANEVIEYSYNNSFLKNTEDVTIPRFVIEAYQDAAKKVQTEMVKKLQESGGMGDLMDMLKG